MNACEIRPWYSTVPWHEWPPSFDDAKGTTVRYDGHVLRARGDYDHGLARALIIASKRHMVAEGIA